MTGSLPGTTSPIEADVDRAVKGDRDALERVVRAIQPDVQRLALRFLWHPDDAADASQEILIRVITRLGSFRGESAFRTWVWRVAANMLLTARTRRSRLPVTSVADFAADLEHGLSDAVPDAAADVERALLLEEVRVGCTMAMLHCLDEPQRMAYILGEIIGLDHNEGAAALEITPAAFRARVSRARRTITGLMTGHCGLIEPGNACRCRKRIAPAVELQRVDPHGLLFASSAAHARSFPAVLRTMRTLHEGQRAAALYRAQEDPAPADFTLWIRRWMDENLAGV